MPDKVPVIYWDACCLLSYINEVEDRMPHLEAILAQAQRGEIHLITSVLSVAEVAFGAVEQQGHALDDETEERIGSLWEPSSPVRLIEFHILIAERAKDILRAGLTQGWTGLRSIDAMHLATAQNEGATAFHTYDGKLEKYGPVIGCHIGPAETDAPQLGI